MSETYSLTLTVKRFDPDRSVTWFQTYKLDAGPILRFVDLFRRINVEQDATLAWASSCEHPQCGSCSVKVNGRPMLACELLVENAVTLFGTTEFKIAPLSVAPVVRDLVVDWERVADVSTGQNPTSSGRKNLPRYDGAPNFSRTLPGMKRRRAVSTASVAPRPA